jgi:hypothetical protein
MNLILMQTASSAKLSINHRSLLCQVRPPTRREKLLSMQTPNKTLAARRDMTQIVLALESSNGIFSP